MTRAALLMAGVAIATSLTVQPVDARPRWMGPLLGLLHGQVGAMRSMLGHRRYATRSGYYRRMARRSRAPAVVLAGGAGAAAVVGSRAETSGSAPAEGYSLRSAQSVGPMGVVGPASWPTAYEDVIGYTFWPSQYDARFRGHGIGDVMMTALSGAPAPQVAASDSTAASGEPPVAGDNSEIGQEKTTGTCGPAVTADWPVSLVREQIQLTDVQSKALDELKAALTTAVATIKSGCREVPSDRPVERLQVMQTRLWTVHDATQLIRAPLQRFYETLDEDQRRSFATPETPAALRATSGRRLPRACNPSASASAVRQVEQAVRPTPEQRAGLEGLKQASGEMGQLLMASCMTPTPATPVERLDAAADRLTAMVFAISNVNTALNGFTATLSPEQQQRLASGER